MLPAVWKMVLYGAVSIGGIFAAYFINKMITRWGNEIEEIKNTSIVTDAKTQVQSQTQALDQQSDDLKKIDGR